MNNVPVEYHFLLSWRQRSELLAMTDQGRMQLLQEIVQLGPAETNWKAILELFASWPESPAKEIAFEWCNQLMESWPDDLRLVNTAWRHFYDGSMLSPIAKIVRSVHILQREQHGNAELQAITRSPYSRDLKQLVIRKSSLYADGMQSLVTSPYLASLNLLALESLTLTDDEFDIFCSASHFHSLTWLRLKNMALNTKLLTRLIQSPLLRRITKLELPFNSLDDNSVSILLASEKCANLQELDVSNNFITKQGEAALRQSAALKNARIIT